jgi:dTDP-4-dehydrorhamnose reductase
MKVLICGASGLLGSSMSEVFLTDDLVVEKHGNTFSEYVDISADLTILKEAERIILDSNPDVIINLCCLSDVDKCERDHNLAFKLNVLITRNLCEIITKHQLSAKFIQISTDQLYNGIGPQAETEVKILNYYSETKYQSEKIATEIGGCVLRTNFFGKSKAEHKVSFSDWVLTSINDDSTKYFSDVHFNPLSMKSLSSILSKIIRKKIFSGVFNLGSRGGMSKYIFASHLASKIGIELDKDRAISIDEISMSAFRPKGMIMDCTKFESTYGIILPTLIEEIDKYA